MTHAGGFDVTVGSTPAYLAVPSGTGPWPGVVVIHESWGLNADVRASAHRLGSVGYLALAPDLYGGKSFVRCLRGVFRQLHAASGPAFVADAAGQAGPAGLPGGRGRGFVAPDLHVLRRAPRRGAGLR